MVIADTSTASRKRLSGASSRVLLLLAFSVFVNYIDRGNLSIAAPLLKGELGISASQLGILLSAFFWTYMALQFVNGWLADRFDANLLLAAGYLVWSFATAATGFVQSLAVLLGVRLLLGIGESVVFPSSSKILARHLPEHYRGFANGLMMAAMKCGPAAGTLGAGLLMAKYGWRPVFIGIGLLSLLWLPAWLKWMPRGEAPARSLTAAPGFVDILRQRSFWGACAGQFCGCCLWYFVVLWLPVYLVEERHLSMQAMAKTAAVFYLVDAASAIATGWLTDLCIRRGLTATVARKSAMALGWTIAAIGLVGCAVAGSHSYLGWLMGAGVGCGMGTSGINAIGQTLAGSQAAGKWTGLQNGFGNLSGVVAPALTGFLVDWTGHYQVALVVTAGISLLSAVSWVFLVGEVKQVAWDRTSQPVSFSVFPCAVPNPEPEIE